MIVEVLAGAVKPCPCIIADNDAVGKGGAESLAEALLAGGIPCRVLVPPDTHGDLRDWVRAGLTSEKLAAAINSIDVRYPEGWPPGFVAVPNALLRNGLVAKIDPTALSVLCVLKSFDNSSHQCHPQREELARLMGVDVRSIDRAKAALEKAGLLRWRRGGSGRANDYCFDLGPCLKVEKAGTPVTPVLDVRKKSKPGA